MCTQRDHMKRLLLTVMMTAFVAPLPTSGLVAHGTKTPSPKNNSPRSANNSPKQTTPREYHGCGTKTPSPPSTPRK